MALLTPTPLDDSATCNHLRLEVVTSLDVPLPKVRCMTCLTVHDLADARRYISLCEHRWYQTRPDDEPFPGIFMRYGAAFYGDFENPAGETGLAIPDLDVLYRGQDHGEVLQQIDVRIFESLWNIVSHSKTPPFPRSIEELRKSYPEYTDWTWDGYDVDIAIFLNSK